MVMRVISVVNLRFHGCCS